MKGKLTDEYNVRMMVRLSKADVYEIDTLAIMWGLDRADIIRIAVKKFLQDPTIDFTLDAKDKKEKLRVKR